MSARTRPLSVRCASSRSCTKACARLKTSGTIAPLLLRMCKCSVAKEGKSSSGGFRLGLWIGSPFAIGTRIVSRRSSKGLPNIDKEFKCLIIGQRFVRLLVVEHLLGKEAHNQLEVIVRPVLPQFSDRLPALRGEIL